MRATVIGAGLAGSEAAWQLAKRGVAVTLYEMKPQKMSPAHKSPLFAELVCSNSLRSDRIQNAVGLLKEEMRALDSLVMRAADAARVPAGGALAVDRTARMIAIRQPPQRLTTHPLLPCAARSASAIAAFSCGICFPMRLSAPIWTIRSPSTMRSALWMKI